MHLLACMDAPHRYVYVEHVGAEGEVQGSAELIVAQHEIREGAVDALAAQSLGQRACRINYEDTMSGNR